MIDEPPHPPELPTATTADRPTLPILTLLILAALVGFMFWGQHYFEEPAVDTDDTSKRYGDVAVQISLLVQGKAIILQQEAQNKAGGTGFGADMMLKEIELETLDGAAVRSLAALYLYAYPDNPEKALEQLELVSEFQPGEDQIHALARQEIEQPGTLTEAEKEELGYQMHWFGDLLFLTRTDASSPERQSLLIKAYALAGYGVIALLLLIVGFIAGLILLPLALIRSSKGTFTTALKNDPPGGRPHIWAFSAYLAIMAAPLACAMAGIVQPEISAISFPLAVIVGVAIAIIFSRGSFRDRRRALGIHTGRGIFREIGSGIVGYCCVLPIALVGAMVSGLLWIIMRQFQSSSEATEQASSTGHPIGDLFFDADPVARLLLLLLAAVGAPLIEELMFRGALHRGLRRYCRIGIAALAGGIIFAVIHPQEVAALPILAALGLGFTLIREWRDSLIPSIIAHSLHNGAIMTGLWLLTL